MNGFVVIGSECESWFSDDGREVPLSGSQVVAIEETVGDSGGIELSVELDEKTWTIWEDIYAKHSRDGVLTGEQVVRILELVREKDR